MNIAMFTNNYKPYIGGVPISIEHLAKALRQRGHKVYVFAPTYKEQTEEEFVIRYPSFPVSIAKAPVPDVLTRIFERKVKELQIDLIHVHHPAIVGNVALSLKKKYKIPVVYTYHTRYEQYLYYVKPLERIERCTGIIQKYLEYFCKRCDRIVAPTPGMRDYLSTKELNVPIQVLPTGIPEECFAPDMDRAAGIRKRYKGDADYLFVTVSRLAREKNLLFQLEGMALLKEKLTAYGKTFRHMILGEGPQRQELLEKAQKLGLEDTIIFTGNVPNEEIRNYQSAADLFLFTSKSETQGIVVLEAMAAGNPVVAVDATGVRDVVKDLDNGRLTSEDAGEWSDSIVAVLKDEAQYHAMSQAARRTAACYSQSHVAELFEGCYEECCQNTIPFPRIYDTIKKRIAN